MRFLSAVLLFSFALLLPAAAYADTPSPSPSPVPSATSTASTSPEDPAFTSVAKAFYEKFAQGELDRSKIAPDLNKLLTDDAVSSLSKNLRASGDPSWAFVSLKSIPEGRIGVYRLAYQAGSIYYKFGMSKGGTVFILYFGPNQ